MKCPRCQHENPASQRFCGECGVPVDGRAPIANSYADLKGENEGLRHSLAEALQREAEALEQQTATSEILRVISSSPTDVQPVFESLVASAARLCGANDLLLLIREGDVLRPAAGVGPFWESLAVDFRVPLVRGSVAARSVIDTATLHVPDLTVLSEADYPVGRDLQRRFGHRTVLAVPLSRKGVALGTIFAMRFEVRPFADQQIALLKTFADQAVIAIENVRLFNELEAKNQALTASHAQVTEALQHQTATSEILQVISRSPTDVQPVFDTIIRSAVRLLGGFSGLVTQIIGDHVHLAALTSTNPSGDAAQKALWPRPVKEDVSVHGQVITALAPYFITDVESDRSVPPSELAVARARGWRSIVAVPLLRDGRAIGSLAVTRSAPGAFADGQVALLQTFADQAVIAIENVRLFTELQEKNRALTEALEQQTATSEILRVISSSPTDLQPVFGMVVRNAGTLCGAAFGGLHRLDSGRITLDAHYGIPDDELMILQRDVFPLAISRGSPTGRAILDREVVHIRDIREDPGFRTPCLKTMQNYRTILAVPMMREGVPLGALALWRREVQPFSETEIGLVRTFADQAVIAIENVRLFTELEARTKELTRSVNELTALGEVGRTLSSTLDLETVLQTIVARANELAGTDGGSIYEYDEAAEVFRLRASSYADPREAQSLDAVGRAAPIPTGQGVVSRAAALRQPVQVPDITIEGSYESPIRGPLLQAGYRAILTVPLLLEERVIGALGVARKTAGDFAPEIVRLLTTFATQSALAIQNARLFREIEQKSRELEAASRHKSEFLANMSHELRTPLNAIIGFSEVLGERMFGDLNEKQDEYLKDIHASGQHLLSLINDILDLSKIEAGRMELEVTDFDLPMAIDNALMLVRERATRRSIALHTTVDERLGQVQADERKIRQVLLNLLSNAIKFTPEGGRIDVHAVPRDGIVEVSVSDTGVGIAPEDREAVFEEFRQVGTAEKKVEGTGLGLALSRKFIELHGSKIWVESQVGEGSTFTFTVPIRRGE